MKIALRVDSSSLMGTGHVMRCLVLANELRNKGHSSLFICRPHLGHIIDWILQQGFTVYCLPETKQQPQPPILLKQNPYESWVGTNEEEDANDCLFILEKESIDWVIVDHYGLGPTWETLILQKSFKILALDDLGRPHNATIITDPCGVHTYSDSTSRKLLGPTFAIIASQYRNFRTNGPRLPGCNSLMIHFGGSDSKGLTPTIAADMLKKPWLNLTTHIITGPGFIPLEQTKIAVRANSNFHIHDPLPHLAHLMSQCQIAFGGGGSSCWERACMGLPTVAISLATNQNGILDMLSHRGILELAGSVDAWNPGDFLHIAENLLMDKEKLNRMRILGMECVDGLGALRVIESMGIDKSKTITFVSNGSITGTHIHEIKKDDLPLATLQCSWDNQQKTHIGALRFDPCHTNKSHIEASLVLGFKDFLISRKNSNQFWMRLIDRPQKLKICLLSDKESWMEEHIPSFYLSLLHEGYHVSWVHNPSDLPDGDICFLLGCGKKVNLEERSRFQKCLVVHESDLPKGRGWSPLTWQILEGCDRIPFCLFEAADEIDSGEVYLRYYLELKGNELLDDLHYLQAQTSFALCKDFLLQWPAILNKGEAQKGEPTFYKKRRPADSQLDTSLSLEQLFPKLRIVDNKRYPAFFVFNEQRYTIWINKHKGEI